MTDQEITPENWLEINLADTKRWMEENKWQLEPKPGCTVYYGISTVLVEQRICMLLEHLNDRDKAVKELTQLGEGLNDLLTNTRIENERLDKLINTPHIKDFAQAVVLEACHQRERFGDSHDSGKQASDWFWLIGRLAGKILNACVTNNKDKALHHCVSTAATLCNWFSAINGDDNSMRPGIKKDET